MADCEECGKAMDPGDEICPACGYAPGPQTVTDMPKTKIWKRKKKTEDIEKPLKLRNVTCENCRTPIPGNTNLCPKCGLAPGPHAWTDLPGRKDK